MPQRRLDRDAEERIKRERERQSALDQRTEPQTEADEHDEEADASRGDSSQTRRDRV